jgi:hypothetical protein
MFPHYLHKGSVKFGLTFHLDSVWTPPLRFKKRTAAIGRNTGLLFLIEAALD